jgi:anti-anti-sigma factor
MLLDQALARYNESHPQALAETKYSSRGDILLGLSGDMEMKASSDMAPLLEAALLQCPGRGRLVLDLSRVGYISSSGVGLLSTTMIAAEKRSVAFVLLDIPPRVRSIMDTLGLLSFFNVEESRD